ncbi:relaxase/mobilization nuclease domain-containing protein [Chryseobacterium sp. B21-037]|uniref:conjugal transfer protein MobB n=1 Tax=Chryseobacterium sp. B21-037 TaxID=2926038 RepID=UPI0023584757|nr:conjugal transfer protein MobB [Chryseobacterium sp. B21-037]MDC8102930.1 relaxase/mobilization nuclease domain-containing protein [Chryseobacterium sp. B21-037]
MIAKIGHSSNLFGVLSYNNLKIEQEKGEILLTRNMVETPNGKYSVSQLVKSFEPNLLVNHKTEKHTLHISLNPDPKDQVSDEQFRQIAQQYMDDMGYGNQPFIAFKHTDIERTHIHIVSVCVDENGKKISDKFEKIRSMKVCRELEKKFGLADASKKESIKNDKMYMPVNYMAGNIKSQIASVIRHLPEHYQFQSLGEYNALLSLFNITVEKVEGESHGNPYKGLLYFPLDSQGKKAGNPFKSSLFGKNTGISALERRFDTCKTEMKDTIKRTLKSEIIDALKASKKIESFKNSLVEKGIDTVIRRNDQRRIYGMTFIDHRSKTVWNGSKLGKECSANVFNEYWNRPQHETAITNKQMPVNGPVKEYHNQTFDVHPIFDFSDKNASEITEAFGGLLPEVQNVEYNETEFESRMRKKRKQKRNK